MTKHILLTLMIFAFCNNSKAQNDPYLWLEDIESSKSLEFVENQNSITFEKLSKLKEYDDIYDKCLSIYNSTDRIEYPSIYGEFIYNFWMDKEHVRGIWRRSPKSNYIEGNPVWETLLDLVAFI